MHALLRAVYEKLGMYKGSQSRTVSTLNTDVVYTLKRTGVSVGMLKVKLHFF